MNPEKSLHSFPLIVVEMGHTPTDLLLPFRLIESYQVLCTTLQICAAEKWTQLNNVISNRENCQMDSYLLQKKHQIAVLGVYSFLLLSKQQLVTLRILELQWKSGRSKKQQFQQSKYLQCRDISNLSQPVCIIEQLGPLFLVMI